MVGSRLARSGWGMSWNPKLNHPAGYCGDPFAAHPETVSDSWGFCLASPTRRTCILFSEACGLGWSRGVWFLYQEHGTRD